eukprot:GHVO01064109.1.p1 GENE.GHVO01064109.1~~GHVO01064109.1.p1  ORF type:complete len:110 (+),score=26.19 GHVO01064109.1:133-462(+)
MSVASMLQKTHVDKDDASIGAQSVFEESIFHPQSLDDETQLAREVNKMSLTPFPNDPSVVLPPFALTYANWDISLEEVKEVGYQNEFKKDDWIPNASDEGGNKDMDDSK